MDTNETALEIIGFTTTAYDNKNLKIAERFIVEKLQAYAEHQSQLPSDEEIEEAAEARYSGEEIDSETAFILGAKWLKSRTGQSQWISAQNLPEKAGTYIAKTKLYFNGVDWEDENEDYFDNNNVIEYLPQPPPYERER